MEKSRFRSGVDEFIKDQQGMVLVFSLLVLIMISMWGAATLTISTNDYHIANSSKKAVQAYYLAEAGLEEAIAKIKKEAENGEINSINDQSYQIEEIGTVYLDFQGPLSDLEITAVGDVDGFQKTLIGDLEIVYSGIGYDVNDINLNITVLITNPEEGDFRVERNETKNGDINVKGEVTIEDNAIIYGNVKAEGEINIGKNVQIYGNVASKTDINIDKWSTIKESVTSEGAIEIGQSSQIDGDVEAKGKVEIDKWTQIQGSVKSENDITIKENSQIDDVVLAKGKIEIDNFGH